MNTQRLSDKELLQMAEYLAHSRTTARKVSVVFGCPVSTFLRGIHERVPALDKKLYKKISKKLARHCVSKERNPINE